MNKSGERQTVSMPGTLSAGGIDSTLAPRTAEQQKRITTVLDAKRHGYPIEAHQRNERIRKVPVVGTWIATKLHGRMIRAVNYRRESDDDALLG